MQGATQSVPATSHDPLNSGRLGLNDGDDFDRKLARKVAILWWIAGPAAYVGFLVQFPDYWAIATGI